MNDLLVRRLKALPQKRNVVWQGAFLEFPLPEDVRKSYDFGVDLAVVPIWAIVGQGMISPIEPAFSGEFEPIHLLHELIDFAESEGVGYRPGVIETDDEALVTYFRKALAGAGIEVRAQRRLTEIQKLSQTIVDEAMTRLAFPGPLDAEGMGAGKLRAFAEAAKLYFHRRFWLEATAQDFIEVIAPKKPGFGVISIGGAAGDSASIDFFSGPDTFMDHLESADDPESDFDIWAVEFSGIDDFPEADQKLWKEYDLPLASVDAHPWMARFTPDGPSDRADADVTAFAEGVMRALADTSTEDIDGVEWQKTVQTVQGEVRYKFRMPAADASKPAVREISLIDGLPLQNSVESLPHTTRSYGEALKLCAEDGPDPDLRPAKNAREAAEDLAVRARVHARRAQGKLARQALRLDPECPMAHLMAANAALADAEKFEHLELAVRHAKARAVAAFGSDAVRNAWSKSEGRVYVRALVQRGATFFAAHRGEEAALSFAEAVAADPEDNLDATILEGLSYLRAGRDADAIRLLESPHAMRHAQDIDWLSGRTLAAFRQTGDSEGARLLRTKLLGANRFVISAITLDANDAPDLETEADEEEFDAADDAMSFNAYDWRETPKAIDWLRAGRRPAKRPGPHRPRRR